MRSAARGGTAVAVLLLSSFALSACGSPDARCSAYIRRGERDLAAGELQKARVEFRDAMQIEPRRADARVMSGRVDERLGDVPDAVAEYQAALDLDPDYVPARANLARLYVLAGKSDRALEILRPGLLRHPDDPDLLAARAAARAGSGDRAGALADSQRAVRIAPGNEGAVGVLAALEEQAGHAQQAVDTVRTALGREPRSTDLHRILADLYARLGKDDLAAAELASLIELAPRDLQLRYRLASLYTRSRRLGDAERVLDAAVAAWPDDDGPMLACVSFLATQRSIGEGERALDAFIARHPADDDLELARAALLLRQGRSSEAMTAYRAVAARAGDRPQGLTARDRLAALLVADRRFDEASSLVEQVLARNGGDTDALGVRADIALARGEAAAAVTDLRAVLRERPGSAPVLQALARAYLAEGQTELAEASLRSAMDVAPQDGDGRVLLAQLLAGTNRADEGISILEERLRQAPADGLARGALVRLYIAKPDLDAAWKAAQQLEHLSPADWRGPYFEGLVAAARGRPKDAESALARALAVQPDAIEALRAISRLDFSSGHSDRALARVESVAAAEPANAAICDMLGELRLADKDPAGAIRELTRCTRIAPAMWLAYHDLGAAQQAAGNATGALRTYEQGVTATRMQPRLIFDLAALDEQEGRPDDAIHAYEALHREFPGLVLAVNNLAMLLVTYRKDRASFDRARDLTSGFLASADPNLLDTAGWVLLKDGSSTAALPVLERAARRAPESHVIRYHLGMAQLEAGQRESARASLEASLAGSARFQGSDDARAALARLADQAGSARPTRGAAPGRASRRTPTAAIPDSNSAREPGNGTGVGITLSTPEYDPPAVPVTSPRTSRT